MSSTRLLFAGEASANERAPGTGDQIVVAAKRGRRTCDPARPRGVRGASAASPARCHNVRTTGSHHRGRRRSGDAVARIGVGAERDAWFEWTVYAAVTGGMHQRKRGNGMLALYERVF
jgi:hypothetical protein